MYVFNFSIFFLIFEKTNIVVVTFIVYHFCRYLVAIKDTLIFERLRSCMCSSPSFPCGSLITGSMIER